MRPQDVLQEEQRCAEVSLDDSAHTICVAHADVKDGDPYEVDTGGGWRCCATGVQCVRCSAFLGVRVRYMERREGDGFVPDIFAMHDTRGVRVAPPNRHWLKRMGVLEPAARLFPAAVAAAEREEREEAYPVSMEPLPAEPSSGELAAAVLAAGWLAGSAAAEHAAEGPEVEAWDDDEHENEWGEGDECDECEEEEGGDEQMVVGAAAMGVSSSSSVADPAAEQKSLAVDQIFLGVRYLRVFDAHRHRPLSDLVPLLCRGCDRTLSYTDQLLCTRRRWGFGRNPPTPACFVNSLVASNIEVRGKYEEMLAQGLMDMSDVYCRCGKQVGYMFRHDKTPNRRNLNQVGRMGLVCSTFRVAPYQLSHAHVWAQ